MGRRSTRNIETRLEPRLVRASLAALILASLPLELSSESLTLTTYYPAPLGVYAQLITTGVGSVNTLLARDGGSVGVGTASPTALLHAVGRGNGTVAELQGQSGDLALNATANNAWNWAAEIQNTNANGYGISLSAPYYGVYSVSTAGGGYGTFSQAAGNWGVGAFGYSSGSGGYGLYGFGDTGVYAWGNATGIVAQGPTGLSASSWAGGGVGVNSVVSGANSTAVQGNNATGSGWSGSFTGGQGLFADRILSTGNNVPVAIGTAWTQPLWATNIGKPSCPAGYYPNIAAFLLDTYYKSSGANAGDWEGVMVQDSGSWCWFVWGGHCMGAYGNAQGYLAGCSGGPWPPDAGMFAYVTYCSLTPFHPFGGCLHTAAQGPCP